MDKNSIEALIEKGEGQDLDFKSKFTNDIGKGICAFANTNDGTILVGVDNKGLIMGVSKKVEEQIANITDSCDPPIRAAIETEIVDGENILVVKVKKSGQVHSWKGKIYVRVGSTNRPLSMQEILELGQKLGKIRFDEQICEGASLEDIDNDKVKWYIDKRKEIRKIEKPDKLYLLDLLLNIGAIKKVNRVLKLTNAGILFFGKHPQRFFIQSQLRIVRFKGNNVIHPVIDRLDCYGTLWEMVEQAEEFIRKNIRLLSFRTDKSFMREDKFEYPIKALREAMINALIHRNYFETADVRVFIFDNKVEVINPGSFPDNVTPERPIHKPINLVLCSLMYDIGFIEKYGSGIYMMNELCRKWGNKKPYYDLHPIETKIIFESPVKESTLIEIEDISYKLNERQKKALDYVYWKEEITRREYMQITKVSNKTAYLDLKDLIDKGLLVQVGKGRGVKYRRKGND